nr:MULTISPECIES: heavy-metal-associated domain-containing protein [unclassified Ornithinimicrobium]
MKALGRLGLYGLALGVVLAGAAATASVVVPEETVRNWTAEATPDHHSGEDGLATGGHDGHDDELSSLGLGVAQGGYQLTDVSAPAESGAEGELSFAVTGPDGNPVTGFELDHDKELHLIAVRADGQHFRHVHPDMSEDGEWSIPWQWEQAGTYRVFADFVPSEMGDGMTLSTAVQVAGHYAPEPATELVTRTTVDGFDVSVEGGLSAGESSELTITITRDGQPVTELQPYLGAFGHLVALRDGDLAYLHVHPHGHEPQTGETSGPEIVFEATAPTPGRYLLYLDFQVDGQVHTAPLVLEASAAGSGARDRDGREHSENEGDQEDGGGDDHG